MKQPLVSVIIPCRNEVRFLKRCLDSILAGDYPASSIEVIVADGMSTDGTRELVAEYSARDARVRMIDNPERVTPVGLNRAIAAARGEVIARVDGHAEISANYLSRCVHYLETTDAVNVGGVMQVVPRSVGPFSDAIVGVLAHRFGVGNAEYRFGGGEPRWVDTVQGGCWHREVFSRVGGFNEKLERTQDMEFNRRLQSAGGKILMAPEIRYDYFARTDLASFTRHNFWNGEWAVLPFAYSEQVPVSLRHLVPLIFALGLFLSVLALAWSWWPMALAAGPYVVANVAASIHASWRARKPSFLIAMPIAFASLHLGYGFGSLAGLFPLLRAKFLNRSKQEEKPCLHQVPRG